MASNLLSDLDLRKSVPKEKPYKLNDGNGLVVKVYPNGSKYFQLRYTLHGKRKLVAEHADPVQEKRKQASQRTEEAAVVLRFVVEEWLEVKSTSTAIE